MIFVVSLPIVFMVFAGIASSCMDMNAHYKEDGRNWLYRYYQRKGGMYFEWWVGGNEKFPPSNPFTGDFWHFAKWMQNLSTTGAILSALLVGHLYPSAWLSLYVFSYGVYGWSFIFFYHYVWRNDIDFYLFVKYLFNRDKI